MHIPLTHATIRDFRDDDVQGLVRHANSLAIASKLRDRFPHPYTEGSAEAWLTFVATQNPRTSFAISDDTGVIGGIGLELRTDIYRRSAELGYWLGETYWGRGIMTESVRAISDWGFESLDLARVFAGVMETNRASCRVLEKAGFTMEGVLRKAIFKGDRLLDEHIYARVI